MLDFLICEDRGPHPADLARPNSEMRGPVEVNLIRGLDSASGIEPSRWPIWRLAAGQSVCYGVTLCLFFANAALRCRACRGRVGLCSGCFPNRGRIPEPHSRCKTESGQQRCVAPGDKTTLDAGQSYKKGEWAVRSHTSA